MKNYSEEDIRRAVNEVVAAGMEEFLFQEPLSEKSSRKSDKSKRS